MWNSDKEVVELVKADKGLGFSILDYQDPQDPKETVIVIRSLVPGGVAEEDGQLTPGDRLLSVNDVNLSHASLDEAVQVQCSLVQCSSLDFGFVFFHIQLKPFNEYLLI